MKLAFNSFLRVSPSKTSIYLEFKKFPLRFGPTTILHAMSIQSAYVSNFHGNVVQTYFLRKAFCLPPCSFANNRDVQTHTKYIVIGFSSKRNFKTAKCSLNKSCTVICVMKIHNSILKAGMFTHCLKEDVVW